jgi:PHD/YefM family antitoxin component YafN of YafNO toxin-antitoxin module
VATIKELQRDARRVLRRVEAEGLEPVTRQGRLVAVVLSAERLGSLVESLELERDPELMKAVAAHKAGRIRFTPVPAADED